MSTQDIFMATIAGVTIAASVVVVIGILVNEINKQ